MLLQHLRLFIFYHACFPLSDTYRRTPLFPRRNNTFDSPPVYSTPLSTPPWRERIVFLLAVEIPKALDGSSHKEEERELLLLPIPSFLTFAYDIGASEKGAVYWSTHVLKGVYTNGPMFVHVSLLTPSPVGIVPPAPAFPAKRVRATINMGVRVPLKRVG